MAANKLPLRKRPCCACDALSLISAFSFVLLLLWTLWSSRNYLTLFLHPEHKSPKSAISNRIYDPADRTFYDDPELSFSVEKPLKNWDNKRKQWLNLHPSLAAGSENRVLLVTGSQPSPCKNPIGDHLLLRSFKNKVDYSRIHGIEIYYNNLYLHPKMNSYWAKLPIIRAAMMAHPETEWIWWMDQDAVFTDMEFEIPLGRYKAHNLVVHGWPNMVYEDKDNKSWTGLNTGSFLIRNCQWTMDLLHVWAQMGPMTPNFEKWGEILKTTFKDKPFPLPDDQSSLIYLLFTGREKWEEKTYLEAEYDLESYWMAVMDRFENGENHVGRRRAEKVSALHVKGTRKRKGKTMPFVTHFTGCQPCNGEHNPNYEGDKCWKDMIRALNYGDNQVLRNYGFVHYDLGASAVSQVPFDYSFSDL